MVASFVFVQPGPDFPEERARLFKALGDLMVGKTMEDCVDVLGRLLTMLHVHMGEECGVDRATMEEWGREFCAEWHAGLLKSYDDTKLANAKTEGSA